MEEQKDTEKIIGELIKKRKEENEAFIKLLSAMESKTAHLKDDVKTSGNRIKQNKK